MACPCLHGNFNNMKCSLKGVPTSLDRQIFFYDQNAFMCKPEVRFILIDIDQGWRVMNPLQIRD